MEAWKNDGPIHIRRVADWTEMVMSALPQLFCSLQYKFHGFTGQPESSSSILMVRVKDF